MRMIFGATLLAMAACTSAAAPAPLLRGTFRPDCAPYDGPAFSITLPHRASATQFRLSANVPISQAAGLWRHTLQAAPGEAMIARCKSTGDGACSYPESGMFRVELTSPDRMRGTIEVTFVGKAPERFRFEAVRQEPKGQWFCG